MLEITLLLFCVWFFVVYFFLFKFITGSHSASSFGDVTHSSISPESSEEKSLSNWENQTPTPEEEEAALKIQAIWRGTYIRKILKSREPGVSLKNTFQKCFILNVV